jgi:hypothetical protein
MAWSNKILVIKLILMLQKIFIDKIIIKCNNKISYIP